MAKFHAFLYLALPSAAGAACAIAINTLLSQGAAFIFRAADLIDKLTRYDLEVWAAFGAAALILIALSITSLFYFRPLGSKGAFACGFCTVAVLSMLAP